MFNFEHVTISNEIYKRTKKMIGLGGFIHLFNAIQIQITLIINKEKNRI